MDNPIEAMLAFLSRVEPYDPDPRAAPIGSVELRTGGAHATFELTGYVARALGEALASYVDPHELRAAEQGAMPRR